MAKQSAGILLYRKKEYGLEVFLTHPGGPLYKNKDDGYWSIPKGEFDETEDALTAAQREFKEETGMEIPRTGIELTPVRTKSGKVIFAWAHEGDFDPQDLTSNLFELEWPTRSGKRQQFPEVDRGEWFSIEHAKIKTHQSQVPLLHEAEHKLL